MLHIYLRFSNKMCLNYEILRLKIHQPYIKIIYNNKKNFFFFLLINK